MCSGPYFFTVAFPPNRPASAFVSFLRLLMMGSPDETGPTRPGRAGRAGAWGGLIGARALIAKDGFPTFLVAALEVLLLDGFLVGEHAIVVLLGRFRAGEDDELCGAVEDFRDEGGMRRRAPSAGWLRPLRD